MTVVSAQTSASYTGEIMDSACAAAGSHDAMIKGSSTTAKQCTEACVSKGAKYVLYDSATKTTYQLSDQKRPAAFAGDKVTVTGKLDEATKTIDETSIKKAA